MMPLAFSQNSGPGVLAPRTKSDSEALLSLSPRGVAVSQRRPQSRSTTARDSRSSHLGLFGPLPRSSPPSPNATPLLARCYDFFLHQGEERGGRGERREGGKLTRAGQAMLAQTSLIFCPSGKAWKGCDHKLMSGRR